MRALRTDEMLQGDLLDLLWSLVDRPIWRGRRRFAALCPHCGSGGERFVARDRGPDDTGFECSACGRSGTLLQVVLFIMEKDGLTGRPTKDGLAAGRVRAERLLRSGLGLSDQTVRARGLRYVYGTRGFAYPSDTADAESTIRHHWPRGNPGDPRLRFRTTRRARGSGARGRGEAALPAWYGVADAARANRLWLLAEEPWEWVFAEAGLDAIALFGGEACAPVGAWNAARLGAARIDVLVPENAEATTRFALGQAAATLRALGHEVGVGQTTGVASAEDLADLRHVRGDGGLWDYLTSLPIVAPATLAFVEDVPPPPSVPKPGVVDAGIGVVRAPDGRPVGLAFTVVRMVEDTDGGLCDQPLIITSGGRTYPVPPGRAGQVRLVGDGLAVRGDFDGPQPDRWSESGQEGALRGTPPRATEGLLNELRDVFAASGPGSDRLARFVVESYAHVAWPDAPVLDLRGDPDAVAAVLRAIGDLAFNPVVVPWDGAGDWALRARRWRGVLLLEPPPAGWAHGAAEAKRAALRLTRGDDPGLVGRAAVGLGDSHPRLPVVGAELGRLVPAAHGPLYVVGVAAPPARSRADDLRDELYRWALVEAPALLSPDPRVGATVRGAAPPPPAPRQDPGTAAVACLRELAGRFGGQEVPASVLLNELRGRIPGLVPDDQSERWLGRILGRCGILGRRVESGGRWSRTYRPPGAA